MKKSNVRTLTNHWDAVWYHYRTEKNLLPKDQMITKFVLPGKTLAWNSLGCRYLAHIPELTVYEQMLDVCPRLDEKFNNVLVLNALELRYTSIQEHAKELGKLCNHLHDNGRLIFGVNSIFINWNRTAIGVDQMFEQFVLIMKQQYQMILKHKVIRPFETASLNGDCFLIFDKQL
jgi:hypothetical protein